jgi:phosphoglycerate dehydrogenase-like enzyme
VVIAPLGANAASVAELAFGLMLALARKLTFADVSTKGGGWDRRGCTGMELYGKTITICGFGRIGTLVADRARAFGMKVVAYDPFLKIEHDASSWSEIEFSGQLNDALSQGDFVSVHMPLTPETKHFFNESAFAAMKRGAFFINTSRGGVMDEVALLHALKTHHLGGAGLDVREVEPPVQPGPLALLDNVILLPHVGAFTHEAQTRTFESVCRDLQRVLEGKPAVDFVNFPEPIER